MNRNVATLIAVGALAISGTARQEFVFQLSEGATSIV